MSLGDFLALGVHGVKSFFGLVAGLVQRDGTRKNELSEVLEVLPVIAHAPTRLTMPASTVMTPA